MTMTSINRKFLERTWGALAGTPDRIGFRWCGIRWMEARPQGAVLDREELWEPRYETREEAYLAFVETRHVGTNCSLTLKRAPFVSTGLGSGAP